MKVVRYHTRVPVVDPTAVTDELVAAIRCEGKAVYVALHANHSRELTPAEMSRLSAALNDGTLSEEARRMRVAGLLNSVVLAETASRNFELGMAEQRGQTENLKR